jgi:acyl-CoA hydrolase
MSVQDLYQKKRISAHDALNFVKDGDFIMVPTAAGEPPNLIAALSEERRRFHGVKVGQVLPMQKRAYFDRETAANVCHVALFLGPGARFGGQERWVELMPNYFSEIPMLIERGFIASDVVFSMASPMDEHGYFALSLGADYTMAAIAKARAVVLEVNPNVPYAHGNCHIHISKIAGLVESNDPIFEVGLPKIGPVQEAIGKYVADLIPDGATLQIGYGGIPDAVVMQLTHKHELGVHTEMIGDGILRLIESGAVTNSRKKLHRGKTVATFALGSRRLYDFMHRNPTLEIHPVEITNDPFLAAQNDNLHSINASLQVDFLGQCCSESMGVLPFSSTGGQTDFVRAANRSHGGKSFLVLPSTAKNDTISRIQPVLSLGAHVTVGKNDVGYIVTEYGVAQLRGKSMRQRALELIAIAHPKFRDELTFEAKQMQLF